MPPRAPIYRPPIPGRPANAKPVKSAAMSGDLARPHSRARGYDRTWERLRRMHLNNNPWCVMCDEIGVARIARIVDHKIPISIKPEGRLDPDNLQSLCKPHHDGKKQREDQALRRSLEGGPA